MKRALAERVKQERLGSPVATPSNSNGMTAPPQTFPAKSPPEHSNYSSNSGNGDVMMGGQQHNQSIPRHPAPPQDVNSAIKKRPRSPNAESSGNVTTYTAEPAKKRPGRPRKNATAPQRNEDTDSDDEADATKGPFYLKHQNAALASELYAYRRRIYLLEREREWRRKECGVVGERVRILEGVWRGMEEGLGLATQSNREMNSSSLPTVPPVSTSSGTDVETAPSLLSALKDLVSHTPLPPADIPTESKSHHVDTLTNFETYYKGTIEAPEDEELTTEKIRWKETNEFASAISSRAKRLHSAILQSSAVSSDTNTSDLKQEIIRLESELKGMDDKLEEIAKARNEAVASERRVRRGLYRLAGGRMSLEDVLKAVEKEDNGVSFMETIAMIDGMNNKSPDGATTSDALSSPSSGVTTKDSPNTANAEEVNNLKKCLQDAQAVSESREKQIAELLSEKEEHLKQINTLLLPKQDGTVALNESNILKSPAYIELSTKLGTAERRVQELEEKYEKTRQRWAITKGDLDLAKKTIEDMEGKHERRWTELLSQFSESDMATASDTNHTTTDMFGSAKKIAELESKLQQSIEAVNRVDTLKATLSESHKMNEALQSKLEDLRTKNAKMVAEKSAARAAQGSEPLISPSASSSSFKRSSSGSAGDIPNDKLQQSYKRVRKELSAAVLSKDQAKLKQERAEKERDALMKTNARLLKQSSEKDDMNAKSLSTILHLKQRNDELEKENAVIKQKSQASQQLSLAARLASNAKDRVGEEAIKEKELMEESIKKLQEKCSSLRQETEHAKGLLSQANEKVAAVTKDLDAARSRCNDLVAESTKKEEEKKQMIESLAVMKKETAEAAKKSVAASSSSGGVGSEFSVEQLTTQVKYLSDRMTCPVCNTREKKCILLRCRHMFCQNCVDENVKVRFSTLFFSPM